MPALSTTTWRKPSSSNPPPDPGASCCQPTKGLMVPPSRSSSNSYSNSSSILPLRCHHSPAPIPHKAKRAPVTGSPLNFKPETPPDDFRPNLRIISCCGNCKYAWFGHANERRGYCRLGRMEKKAINRKTPNKAWIENKIHSTNLCDRHQLKVRGYWNVWVSKWLDIFFDNDGEMIDGI